MASSLIEWDWEEYIYELPGPFTTWLWHPRDASFPLQELAIIADLRLLLEDCGDEMLKSMALDVGRWIEAVKTEPNRHRLILLLYRNDIVGAIYQDMVRPCYGQIEMPRIRALVVHADFKRQGYELVLVKDMMDEMEIEIGQVPHILADAHAGNMPALKALKKAADKTGRSFRRLGPIFGGELQPDGADEGEADDGPDDLIAWALSLRWHEEDLKALLLRHDVRYGG